MHSSLSNIRNGAYKNLRQECGVGSLNAGISASLANSLSNASNHLVYSLEARSLGINNNGPYCYTDIFVLNKPVTHANMFVINVRRMRFSPGAKVAEVYVRTGTDGKPITRISLFKDRLPTMHPSRLMQMLGHFEPKQLDTEKAIRRIKRMLRGVGSLSIEHM